MLDVKSHSIAHWTMNDRTVRVQLSPDGDEWILGIIIGMFIKPVDKFAARIVFFDPKYSVHGAGNAHECHEGPGGFGEKKHYQFVQEHPDVARLREQLQAEKAKTLRKEADAIEHVISKMDAQQQKTEVGAVAQGASGAAKRVSAVRTSRLPEVAGGKDAEGTASPS